MALANQPSSTALHRAFDTIASFLEGFEPGRYSGPDAAALVATFAKGERLCAAGKTLAAKRAAEANQHREGGHRSPAHWLAGVTGESVGEAMDVLSLGDSLATHPGMDSAYREGKLSRSKAKAIAGAVRVNPDSEDELVRTAETDTVRQTRDRCQRARAQGRSSQDEKARYAALHRDRSCRTWTDAETGAFRLDARLTPDAGAALLASLNAECDRVFHRARKAELRESHDAYAADALVSLVTGGTGSRHRASNDQSSGDKNSGDKNSGDKTSGDKNSHDKSSGDKNSHDKNSHDKNSHDKNSHDKNSGDKTTKTTKPTRAVVHVRVDLDALRSGVVGPQGICEIPGVGPIPVDTAKELMGDALCHLVITNGIDVTTITKLGRTAIPAALLTALDERDATCVIPGCDATTGLHNHHIVEVSEQGPTALSNLAKLCSHHHALRHHAGFTLAGGPGHWQWLPPGADPDPPAGSAQPSKPSKPSTRSKRTEPSPRSTPSKRSTPSSTRRSKRPTGRNRTAGSARRRPDADDPPRLFSKQE